MSRLSSIRRIHAIVLFLLISAAVATACAVNPVTGKRQLMLSFSRDNEREADRLGIEYATTGGWAAGEMANFFATLERMRPKSGGGLPDWLSTHPAPEKRVESVRELAEEWRGKVEHATLLVNQEDYLQLIEGLVYGADPRQGFVRDGWFNHPGLTFRFPLPEGWTVVNEPTRVQLTDPDEEAVILFTIGSSTSPEEGAITILSTFLLTSGIPADRLEEFSLLNGRSLDDHLAAGEAVKIVEPGGN